VGGYFGSCALDLTGLTNKGNVSGRTLVGGITGSNENKTVSKCGNEGLVWCSPVSGRGVTEYIGGIVGRNNGQSALVSGCTSTCSLWNAPYTALSAPVDFDTWLPSALLAGNYVGGIAGGNNGGTVRDSTFAGLAAGGTSVGGIVGRNLGTVRGCTVSSGAFNNGIVEGTGNVGGFIGANQNDGTLAETGITNGPAAIPTGLTDHGASVDVTTRLKVVATEGYAGGYIGADETASAILEDLDNHAFVYSRGGAGGIIGLTNRAIQNCTNRLVVQGASSAGGVVGTIRGSAWDWVTADVYECYNEGKVCGSLGQFLGGVVGTCSTERYILSCANRGTVSNTFTASGCKVLGGVVGYLEAGTVEECTNTGDVRSNYSGCEYAAGVVGSAKNGIVTNCENAETAVMRQNKTDYAPILRNAGYGVAGIIGRAGTSASGSSVSVSACRSYPDITSDESKGSSEIGCAGIAGTVNGSSAVTGCTNYGALHFARAANAGGIAGCVYSTNAKVTDCENAGDLLGENNVGGVAGSSAGTVDSCTCSAAVSGSDSSAAGFVGGLVGRCGDKATLSASTYSGLTVTGSRYVGGLAGGLGSNRNSTVHLTDCTFALGGGTLVRGSAEYVGGLVGSTFGIQSGNRVTGNYDITVEGKNSVGGIIGVVQNGANTEVDPGDLSNGDNFSVLGHGIRIGGLVGELKISLAGTEQAPIVNHAEVPATPRPRATAWAAWPAWPIWTTFRWNIAGMRAPFPAPTTAWAALWAPAATKI